MNSSKIPMLYRESVKKWAWRILISFCVLPILIEALFLKRKSYFSENGIFSIDGMFAFYAVFAFLGCSLLIFICKFLSGFLKTRETYYNDDF